MSVFPTAKNLVSWPPFYLQSWPAQACLVIMPVTWHPALRLSAAGQAYISPCTRSRQAVIKNPEWLTGRARGFTDNIHFSEINKATA